MKTMTRNTFLVVAGCLMALAMPATATVTLATSNANAQTTTALTGYATDGNMMNGMAVTVYFSNSYSETVYWNSGNAIGTGWSLSETGDTYGGVWTLSNNTTSGQNIQRFFIDAGIGNSMFDVNFDSGAIGAGNSSGFSSYETPGSARGWSFALQSGSGLDILATYSGPVGIGSNAPVGDLYRYLDVQLTNSGGLASGANMTYITDTDSAQLANDVKPTPDAASTLGLLGIALMGLAGLKRRIA